MTRKAEGPGPAGERPEALSDRRLVRRDGQRNNPSRQFIQVDDLEMVDVLTSGSTGEVELCVTTRESCLRCGSQRGLIRQNGPHLELVCDGECRRHRKFIARAHVERKYREFEERRRAVEPAKPTLPP
jgi:hypothetical protein